MRIHAFLLLALLCACGDSPEAEQPPVRPEPAPTPAAATEWVKPYDGWLPDTAPEGTAVVRVVDERTGRPIPGAVVRRHLEMEMGPDGWGPSFEEARSDEYGIAVIEIVEERAWSSHWAVHADGYGSTETYGVAVSEDVELLPGRDVHGRIVDAMGRPAADMTVQYKLGCGHAPPMVETRTDANGVFVLRGIAENGDVAYSGPGILVDYFDGPLRRLDETPHTHAAAPGMRIRGRIVGAKPEDLEPRIVHSQSTTRGVIARIQDDGSFVLDGVARESMLDLYWAPDGEGRRINSEDFRVDVPLVWDVRTDYANEDESSENDVEIPWSVVDANGAPVEAVDIHAYRSSNGWEAAFDYRPGGGREPLVLAPGRYDVLVGDATSRWVAPARGLVIEAGAPKPLVINATEQPRLVLQWASGSPPEDCSVTLAFTRPDGRIDHEGQSVDLHNDPEYAVHLPADAPARVAVRVGLRTRFFDVGPSAEGRRTARIDWPAPTTLRFEAPADVTDVEIGELDHDFAREGGAIVVPTQLEGRLRLRILRTGRHNTITGTGERLVDVPAQPGRTVRMAPLAFADRPLGQVTLQDAAGRPIEHEEIDVRWFDPATGELDYDEVHTNEHGVAVSPLFRADACLRWVHDSRMDHGGELASSGPWTQRAGSCRIHLTVRGPDGPLEEPVVLFRDALYVPDRKYFDGEAPVGSFTLAEVPPGIHRLVVTAPGHVGEQRQIILTAGETRTIEVVLPKR